MIYTPYYFNASVQVALSNPGGGFATPVSSSTSFNTGAITFKDINQDGKPDLITTSLSLAPISVLLGNGDGSFNGALNLPIIDFANSIATGDFDADGGIDLAIANGSSLISIFQNRSLCVPGGSVVPASSASTFRYRVAPNSMVTLSGENLATATRTAIPPLLPTSLANARVTIKDSAGIERPAPLYYVSPRRIIQVIPAQTSPGIALITVTSGGSVVAQGVASIAPTAPGLFSADLSGLANVKARIGSDNAEVVSARSQGVLPGVDQVKVRLLPALQGRGEVPVDLLVDGRAANTVRIKLK